MTSTETTASVASAAQAGATEAKCPQCGTEGIALATVRSAFWEGEKLVVVEGIPALICPHCREQFYDDQTATILDLLRGSKHDVDLASRFLKVPVFSFERMQRRSMLNMARAAK